MTESASQASNVAGRDRLRDIIKTLSFRRGQFKLASGKTSEFFFDLKPTMLDPEGIDLIADQVLEKIDGVKADSIGGLVMGAVPIVVATVLKSRATRQKLRGFWVRKEQKDHGTMNLIDGHLTDGARIIIVEDVTTTGGSALKAIEQVQKRGCEVAAVITIVDRLDGARENLAARGIGLLSVFDLGDFT